MHISFDKNGFGNIFGDFLASSSDYLDRYLGVSNYKHDRFVLMYFKAQPKKIEGSNNIFPPTTFSRQQHFRANNIFAPTTFSRQQHFRANNIFAAYV
jgi:hypothetical protein